MRGRPPRAIPNLGAKVAELRLPGKVASGGFAAGPVVALVSGAHPSRSRGDAAAEAAALKAAIEAALAALGELAGGLDGDAAEILAFQIAMLEDESLAAPAFTDIPQGVSADRAWQAALDAEIGGYQAAADEHFRARANDLVDIRDRVLAHLSGIVDKPRLPAGAILLAEDLTPSLFLATDWSRGGGIALTRGSASGHVATLARARGIPMLIGIAFDLARLPAKGEALIDSESAMLWLDPSPSTLSSFAVRRQAAAEAEAGAAAFKMREARTRDGTPISVLINIADPAEIDGMDPRICDGVGLVRTEFLFHDKAAPPGEEEQYRIYRRLAEWASGKPVTIRTLDAGADKPIAGLTLERETNPFLGLRGIRLSLARPELFRVQLRALCRAAMHGAVEVMLPMVTLPAELAAARRLLEEELAALRKAGVACRQPPLGIMVEVPAAALVIEAFDAAFFSIGSNDLTQYVMAAARDNDAVSALADPSHPAVLRLIERVAAHGAAIGRKVSLCGDAGAEPRFAEALIGAGLRTLSVAPAALARIKQALAHIDLSGERR